MIIYESSETFEEIIPLDKIILDSSIVNAVKRYRGTIKKGTLIDDKKFTVPLNRMESSKYIPSAYEAMKKRNPLPPVILKRYGNTGYYTIIEGKHRIASSILLNHTDVPANIE